MDLLLANTVCFLSSAVGHVHDECDDVNLSSFFHLFDFM